MRGGKGSSISAFDQMAAPELILKKVERIGKTKKLPKSPKNNQILKKVERIGKTKKLPK